MCFGLLRRSRICLSLRIKAREENTRPASCGSTAGLYSQGGRHVPLRTLVHSVLAAGEHSVSWDGRDDHGASLPSSLYFYRLEAGGKSLSGRIVKATLATPEELIGSREAPRQLRAGGNTALFNKFRDANLQKMPSAESPITSSTQSFP